MPEPNHNSMQDLKPTVWIGKQGCTATMIEEIVAQLKKRRLIKVKWLQNTEVDPEAVAAQAKAKLVEVRGRTMVLADKGKAAPAPVKKSANTPAKAPSRAPAHAPRKAARKEPVKPTAKSRARASVKSMLKAPVTGKTRELGTMTRSKK